MFHFELKSVMHTEVRFASFQSGGFITVTIVNPPKRKLAKRTSVHCPKDPKLQIRFMNSAVGLSLYHLIPDYVLRSGAKTLSLFHVIFHLFPLIDRHIQPPGIGYSVIYTFFPFCKQNFVSRIFAPKKHMYLPQGQVGSRVFNPLIQNQLYFINKMNGLQGNCCIL